MTKREIKAKIEAIEEEIWYAGVAYDWAEARGIVGDLVYEKKCLMKKLEAMK